KAETKAAFVTWQPGPCTSLRTTTGRRESTRVVGSLPGKAIPGAGISRQAGRDLGSAAPRASSASCPPASPAPSPWNGAARHRPPAGHRQEKIGVRSHLAADDPAALSDKTQRPPSPPTARCQLGQFARENFVMFDQERPHDAWSALRLHHDRGVSRLPPDTAASAGCRRRGLEGGDMMVIGDTDGGGLALGSQDVATQRAASGGSSSRPAPRKAEKAEERREESGGRAEKKTAKSDKKAEKRR
uniref:DUF3362 domain-containing protein n=1 Tax=Macrostomum lignano TaxID=282301 RepID=A0A1I8FAD3_9PLAT